MSSLKSGSSGVTINGFCSNSLSNVSGTYFLSTTRRNMYSLNQRLVMMIQPWWPLVAPQLFSTFHLIGLPSLSRSTAVRVMAWVEPESNVAIRSALFMGNVVEKSDA